MFSNSSGLKSVFQEVSFCDGLGLRTISLSIEIKLRFQISPAWEWHGCCLSIAHAGHVELNGMTIKAGTAE